MVKKMNNPWEGIKTPLSNYNVRRADAGHSYEFFWGRDIAGDYLFLFQCNGEVSFPEKLPRLHGIDVRISPSADDNLTRMILYLKNREDWDIFHSLCLDLLRATADCQSQESVVAVIVRRLEKWHMFLKRYKARLLSESEQKGLIGELLFLKEFLMTRFQMLESLSFWQGPLDSPQDFCVGDTAVEVKCQIGTSKPLVRISSIDQLHTQLKNMYLMVVTVGKTSPKDENHINLPIIVNQIRDLIQSKQPLSGDMFELLLLKTGYMDFEEYNGFYFLISKVRFYEVRSGFPRLSFEYIPEGVTDVNYCVMLDKCADFLVGEGEIILGSGVGDG